MFENQNISVYIVGAALLCAFAVYSRQFLVYIKSYHQTKKDLNVESYFELGGSLFLDLDKNQFWFMDMWKSSLVEVNSDYSWRTLDPKTEGKNGPVRFELETHQNGRLSFSFFLSWLLGEEKLSSFVKRLELLTHRQQQAAIFIQQQAVFQQVINEHGVSKQELDNKISEIPNRVKENLESDFESLSKPKKEMNIDISKEAVQKLLKYMRETEFPVRSTNKAIDPNPDQLMDNIREIFEKRIDIFGTETVRAFKSRLTEALRIYYLSHLSEENVFSESYIRSKVSLVAKDYEK